MSNPVAYDLREGRKLISKITGSNSRFSAGKRQSSTAGGNETAGKLPKEPADSLMSAVNNVSTYVQNISREVHLYVDESEGDCQVTVVDSSTGHTLRRIPSDEMLALSRQIDAKISDPLKGLLVKSSV